MSVHEKLMKARIELQKRKLSKSGHNKFAGYKYFELGDFLPTVQEIFFELGLSGVISYDKDTAVLRIQDFKDKSDAGFREILITSPMSTAALKGCHEVQNLGAVQTYIRRYLWVTAMEIVEHDALDSTTGASEPSKPKPVAEKPKAPPPTNQPLDSPWAISIGSEGKWPESVVMGASKALEMAKSKDDVLQIFKVNRTIFERLQTEDKATYDDLMSVFADYKNRFNKEQ